MTHFTRRELLAGAASLPALAALPSLAVLGSTLGAAPAQAQTPTGQQVPGIYRFKVGDIELTAVNDGARVGPIADGFVKNATREQINTALQAAFLPKDQLTSQFNPLLINTGSKLVLIDTGNGPQTGTSTVGKLLPNLAWAGVKPSDIGTVVISHFHGDHINGLRSEGGGLAFPEAEILVPAKEWAFWMDDGQMSRAPEGMQAAFKNVRRVFKDLDTRI